MNSNWSWPSIIDEAEETGVDETSAQEVLEEKLKDSVEGLTQKR